ncbi:MAG TPA: serine hydrolase domain-containing protein [Rhodanobacter sp.]|nr:serine hydrolase domain-containing protein [Rhodanobacter sp.]
MPIKPIMLLAVLLIACGNAHAGDANAAKVDAIMHKYSGDVPGASLLILKNGKPLVSRGYGMANLEARAPATPTTDYRLASVTKQFIAAAILLLRQDGKLHLHDSVRQWLPTLPAGDAGVSIENLLDHSGGLTDYEDLVPANLKRQVSDADVLRWLSADTGHYFAPGKGYRYSNTGYVLLGLIIERASHMTLPAFLKQRIFDPLGMTHTLLYEHQRGPQVPHRAYGYSELDGKWTLTDQGPTSATRGDGGIYSCIADLAKWDAALYDGRLLDDASRKLAFSPHIKVTGEPYQAYYGFGWRITGDTLWHSGESIGFRNVIVRWPKRHLTVVLLSNRNEPEPYRTALAVAQPYLQEP